MYPRHDFRLCDSDLPSILTFSDMTQLDLSFANFSLDELGDWLVRLVVQVGRTKCGCDLERSEGDIAAELPVAPIYR